MLTALIDYESGNLHSALKAFEKMAVELDAGDVVVTSDPDVVARADRLVLALGHPAVLSELVKVHVILVHGLDVAVALLD